VKMTCWRQRHMVCKQYSFTAMTRVCVWGRVALQEQ